MRSEEGLPSLRDDSLVPFGRNYCFERSLMMPEPKTAALDLTCAECGRSPEPNEVWRVCFADLGEAVTYCWECAERGFGERQGR
jgi:hypothetical protein